jgi:hypothetical protein
MTNPGESRDLSNYHINYQPLNPLFALLAIYTTVHNTYFTDCETKVTVRVGYSKRNVNAPIPLSC